MSKLSVSEKIYSDEIDIINLIKIIWDGKWKIFSIIAISLLSVFVFNILKSDTTFTARTEIKPINSFTLDQYNLFNSSLKEIESDYKGFEDNKLFNIYEITEKSLLDLYIYQIEEGSLLETAIDKYNLINKDDFDSESEYKDAIAKFVSTIKVIKPTKTNETL